MIMITKRNHTKKIEIEMINQETMTSTTIRNHTEKIEIEMINQENTVMIRPTNTTTNQQNIHQSTQKRDTTAMNQTMEWIMTKNHMEKITTNHNIRHMKKTTIATNQKKIVTVVSV